MALVVTRKKRTPIGNEWEVALQVTGVSNSGQTLTAAQTNLRFVRSIQGCHPTNANTYAQVTRNSNSAGTEDVAGYSGAVAIVASAAGPSTVSLTLRGR